MVFACCMAIDKMDEVLMSGSKLTFRALLPGLLFGTFLFFLRTALALAFFLGVIAHLVLASKRVISFGKKVIAGLLVAVVLLIGIGTQLIERSSAYLELVRSDSQETNMEWRSGKTGNSFAKYAGAAVFAPMIFTIPFPTMNEANEIQYTQVHLAGGSYIKNVLSFFVIVVLFVLLFSGNWRNHVFIWAYTSVYLVVLVFSSFAQSGRFHMPVLPMLMIFAAYGLQYVRQDKKFITMYIYVLLAEVVVCLAWNWFKLAGRGLI